MPNYMIGTESGSVTTSTTDNTATGSWYEYTTPNYDTPQKPVVIPTPISYYPNEYYDWKWGISKENKLKGGNENMRYLYEVILVNPKTEAFLSVQIIARSETSALMKAYDKTDMFDAIDFDDLKTSCRVLMEWKKNH